MNPELKQEMHRFMKNNFIEGGGAQLPGGTTLSQFLSFN
jgi:hypothetical protein